MQLSSLSIKFHGHDPRKMIGKIKTSNLTTTFSKEINMFLESSSKFSLFVRIYLKKNKQITLERLILY